jgi:putative acetyltransferase
MTEVTIRALEMADWEDVAALFLAPICRWGTLQMPYQSCDEIKQKLENSPAGVHRLVAVVKDSQKVVGMIGLHTYQGRRAHVGAIGMSVHDDYQNQGVGSKLMAAVMDLAENWLNLKRLELTVYTDNPKAIHLYEKYGFVIEGTLRQWALRDGAYIDAYTMARLSNEGRLGNLTALHH